MKLFQASVCAAAAISLAGCYGTLGNDEGERYLQRKDTVTLSAGDAKEVNARTHMLSQWPNGVGDRRIVHEGSRMARAAECYRSQPLQRTGGTSSQAQTTPTAGGGSVTQATSQPTTAGNPNCR